METVPSQKAATAVETFETETCSRCGGSGNYSFCQTYGTTCFKCHGAGKYLSKHGQKNYDAWRAAVDAATVRPVTDLKVGDFCKANDDFRKYYRATDIQGPVKGCFGRVNKETNVTVWAQVFNITFDRDIKLQSPCFGSYTQRTFEVETSKTVRIYPGAENMPKAVDFITAPPVKRVRKAK